jgi:hypothetical protein
MTRWWRRSQVYFNSSRQVAGAFGVGFVLFWSISTLFFDFLVGRDIVMQLPTCRYAATDGTITKSEVTEHGGARGGTSYAFQVKYDYLVGDRRHTGDTYRYQYGKNRNDARALARRITVGSRHAVYYDPGDPSQAVLLRGLEGSDLFFPMFLAPFNLVMVVGWLSMCRRRFPRPQHAETGGVAVRDDGMEMRVFLPDHSATFVLSFAVVSMCILMTFVVGFSTGFAPSLGLMLIVWGAILAVGLVFAAPRFYRNWRGWSDLVIDRFGKRLTLPATFGRRRPRDLEYAAIESIRMQELRRADSEGDVTYDYRVVVRERNDDEDHCIWLTGDQAKARRFLTWLRTTIGIAADVQPKKPKARKQDRMTKRNRRHPEIG